MKTTKNTNAWVRAALLTGAAAVPLGYWFYQQQNHLVTPEISVEAQGIPAAFDGLRIVQLTDLHGKVFGRNHSALLQAVKKLRPDLIAVTGDLIDRESQIPSLPALAKGLVSLAPTYFVTGNHEWKVNRVTECKQLLGHCGVRVLGGSYDLLTREGQAIGIAGLEDAGGLVDDLIPAQDLRQQIPADYVVLLTHRDTVEKYTHWNYDLILCGHGHGGIVRIPLVDRGVFSSENTLFPAYDGGLYPLETGGWCYVSRGLGSNTVPFHAYRLFNPPELPVLVLKAKGKKQEETMSTTRQ